MKVQLLKVADVPAHYIPSEISNSLSLLPHLPRLQVLLTPFSEVTDSGSDTASQQSNFFKISNLLEVSERWYFCNDLTSLCFVRSITNLSGIPFCSPQVAVVARRLWFVNWPSIPGSLHNLLTVSSSMLWPNWKMYKKILWHYFLQHNAYNLLYPLKLTSSLIASSSVSTVKLSLKDFILIVFELLESYIFFLALEAITIAAANCKTSFMRESLQCTSGIQDGGRNGSVENFVYTQAES